MKRILFAVLTGPLAACTTMHYAGHASTVPAATEQQKAQLFGQVAKLAGTWESKDDKGQNHVSTIYAVTSGGSAIREIMVPGGQYEMTNLYHMDGPTLVMTHYCAAGNQPRMRASCGPNPNVLDFQFDSVTDLHNANDHYMGQMRLTIVDNDHIKQEWYSFANGKLTAPTTFEMTRKH